MKLKVQCKACRGTGVYRGFAEAPGVGVVCSTCKGTGEAEIEYTPFTGRQQRDDIQSVCYGRTDGRRNVLGQDGSISYQEFIDGKLPTQGDWHETQ